jgi:hypothetical protein
MTILRELLGANQIIEIESDNAKTHRSLKKALEPVKSVSPKKACTSKQKVVKGKGFGRWESMPTLAAKDVLMAPHFNALKFPMPTTTSTGTNLLPPMKPCRDSRAQILEDVLCEIEKLEAAMLELY